MRQTLLVHLCLTGTYSAQWLFLCLGSLWNIDYSVLLGLHPFGKFQVCELSVHLYRAKYHPFSNLVKQRDMLQHNAWKECVEKILYFNLRVIIKKNIKCRMPLIRKGQLHSSIFPGRIIVHNMSCSPHYLKMLLCAGLI